MVMEEFSSIDFTEGAVIGQLILDGKLIIRADELGLDASDFSDMSKVGLYRAMKAIYSQGQDITVVTIKDFYDKNNIECSVNALSQYALMATGNFDGNVQLVKQSALSRRLRQDLDNILLNIKSKSPEEVLGDLQSLVDNTMQNGKSVDSMVEQIADIKRIEMTKAISTGFTALDDLLGGGFRLGTMTVLTGEPGSGKSTLINQFVASAIDSGDSAFIYSGELTNFNVLQWLMRTVASVEHLQEFKNIAGVYYDVNHEGEFLIRKWLKDKLFIFGDEISPSIKNICLSIEYLSKKGVKLFVVDNLMTVEEDGMEELERQKLVAKRLKAIARKHNVAVILIAHPKKRNEKKEVHMFDVAGASEVVNLADYVLMLSRDITEESDETKLAVLKNRITGKQRAIMRFRFDNIRKRFWDVKSELNKDYGYDEFVKKNQISYKDVSDDMEEELPF